MRMAPRPRAGFTLLEVLLASAIAVGLMSGLYMAMDICLGQMQAGREVVEQSSLSRALFARVTNDLTSSLAPTQPAPSNASATAGPTVVFQVGVKGDLNRVAIYLTRLTRSVVKPPDDANGTQSSYVSDVRRICYFWTESGLARQEILAVTSDQVDDLPSEVDENTKILANEAKEFEVRYYDGTSWQESWDGSSPGPDGKTPMGPPRAIEITVTLGVPGSDETKTYKHVIAFPAAPGAAAQDSTTTMP
jgi:prepilin-type N-terminal cleavage/methylation domain-containing protein